MLATPRAGRLKILGGYIHKTRERESGEFSFELEPTVNEAITKRKTEELL